MEKIRFSSNVVRVKMNLLVILALLLAAVSAAPKSKFALKNIPLLDGRIVGGEAVSIKRHPYMASVQLLDGHWCGGAIVSAMFVVSAAHCFDWPISWYTIRVGSSIHNSGGQLVDVQEIYNHPSYNPDTVEYDISVLQVATPLEFGRTVATIALPVQGQYIPDGTRAVVSGWGALSEGGPSPLQLQAVSVPIVNIERCEAAFSDLGWPVTDSMICAGYEEGGRDACQGDSGGPLTVRGRLIGLVSWGYGCARPQFPGVYVNVSHVRPFIAKITGI